MKKQAGLILAVTLPLFAGHFGLDEKEEAFLKTTYSDLTRDQMREFVKRLSSIRTGEMVPYYIMRYGFYEGHTKYRADPIAIAFIFGMRSLAELETALPGRLRETLTMHFSRRRMADR